MMSLFRRIFNLEVGHKYVEFAGIFTTNPAIGSPIARRYFRATFYSPKPPPSSTRRNFVHMSLPQVPQGFYAQLESQFDEAVKSGDLVYSESTQIPIIDEGIQFVYTYAPSLAVKPTHSDVELQEKVEKTPFDPFANPHPKLTVLDDFGTDNAYRVVLNKFAVQRGHFLLVTKESVSQSSILTAHDVEAAYSLLTAANKQSGKRHIGFYNCGKLSGASIDHKHIQFLALPDTVTSSRPEANAFPYNRFTPFPDELVASKRDSFHGDDNPLAHSKLPFNHYIVPLPKNYEETPEILHMRFASIMSRALTVFVKKQRERAENGEDSLSPKDLSYNIVFTEEWILLVPRQAEKFKGISVNSVGTVGLLLAKSEDDINVYREQGPIKVLEQLAYPYENIEFGTGDEDLLYTRY